MLRGAADLRGVVGRRRDVGRRELPAGAQRGASVDAAAGFSGLPAAPGVQPPTRSSSTTLAERSTSDLRIRWGAVRRWYRRADPAARGFWWFAGQARDPSVTWTNTTKGRLGMQVRRRCAITVTVAVASASLLGVSAASADTPPAPVLTLRSPAAHPFAGRTFHLSGTLTPAAPGDEVRLQRRTGGEFQTIATQPLSATGGFDFGLREKAVGAYAYRRRETGGPDRPGDRSDGPGRPACSRRSGRQPDPDRRRHRHHPRPGWRAVRRRATCGPRTVATTW